MGQKLSKCILFSFQNTESMVASFYQPVTKTQIQIYHLLFVLICDLKRKEVKLLLFFSNHTPQQPVNTSFINSHLVFCHQLMKWSGQENGHFFQKSQQSPYVPSAYIETDASNLRLGWISWIYSLCCNCWANEDTNTFSTSKWPSEPYFCERYKYQCSYFNWLQSCDLKRKLIIFSPVANLMHQSLLGIYNFGESRNWCQSAENKAQIGRTWTFG